MPYNTTIAALGTLLVATSAQAYEYPLQIASGGIGQMYYHHDAGYAVVGNTVTGDCTFFTATACSGRGCHPNTYRYYQGCVWDLHGTLMSTTPGQPSPPPPISVSGSITVYATNGQGVTTGTDGANGFVNAPSAQYAWVSPPPYVFLSADKPYDIVLFLQNLGDQPLAVTGIAATPTLARASIKRATCLGVAVSAGKACKVVVAYDPTKITRGDNPYTAYDSLTVSLTSNSGQSPLLRMSVETPIPPIP